MKKALCAVVASLAFAFTPPALAEKGKRPAPPPSVAAVEEMGGFSSPESVATDDAFLYVSNVGAKLAPSDKDGDGFISKLDLSGKVVELKFLPKDGKLDAPKGMAVAGDVLYTADIDRVVGFDLKSGKRVFELSFAAEKTAFLNDLTAKGDGTLFLSGTDIGKVFEIDIKAKSYAALDLAVNGPNGLFWDGHGNRLFLVEYGGNNAKGVAGMVVWKRGKPLFKRIGDREGSLDGVAPLGRGAVMYSDWVGYEGKQGVIWVTDIRTGATSKLDVPAVGGPADFLYLPKENVVWLPKMMEGKLLRIALKR